MNTYAILTIAAICWPLTGWIPSLIMIKWYYKTVRLVDFVTILFLGGLTGIFCSAGVALMIWADIEKDEKAEGRKFMEEKIF